jgi:hypothetical protein
MNVMNVRNSIRSNLDVFTIILAIAAWVILISDNPLTIYLGAITGLTTGLVYYFIKSEKGNLINIPSFSSFLSPIIIVLLFIVLVFAIFTANTSIIYLNWYGIQATDWIRFIITNAFLTFIPGFIILNLVDRENKISTMPRIVMSFILSLFFSSILVYVVELITLDLISANILFIIINFVLVILYILKISLKREMPVTQKFKELNINLLLAIGFLVVFSVILVYLQQFIYQPFVRGDNWNYLATSNYIDKGSTSLMTIGKFYSIKSLSIYELYNLGLFRFSGFPSVNSMMITSVVIASLMPIAFYVMCHQYLKSKKISLLSTLIYVVVSGFGWIPFISQKFSPNLQQYLPQELFAVLSGFAPQVLNDISQPQGSIPEGFKTYVLAIVSIFMLLYLLKSHLPSKTRMFLLGGVAAFAFLVHIETTLAFFFVFLPAYVLLSKQLSEVRESLVALALGILAILLLGLSSPEFLIVPFELNYLLVAAVLSVLLIYTYLRNYLKAKIQNFKCYYSLFKWISLIVICYFYFLSLIVLFLYGYSHMYYGDAVVYMGFTFPWYYYPVSFGIAGALFLVGLFMNFEKYRTLSFFVLAALLTVLLGILVSYLNLNFFNTGTKEWRLIYRVLPIATSVFAGWVLFKLMIILKNTDFHIGSFIQSSKKRHKISLMRLTSALLVIVIILGVPSTIISSEYWMSSNSTPFGPAYATPTSIELANFVKQNVPITSRVATLGDMSNAVVKLAGGTTAVPTIYPDFLLSSHPETVALLSSDIGYVCIDRGINDSSANRDFVSYLPLVFNNSRFLVYRLPYLESSSESDLGYVSPLKYNNATLLSYLILASLNSSYQSVNDDFDDKSTIIAPSDFAINGQNMYNFNSSVLLHWVQEGGKFIVIGGQGTIFDSFGFVFNRTSYQVNGISTASGIYPTKTLNVKSVGYVSDDVHILSYYSVNGSNVAPFIAEKRIGNGSVFYVYVDPIYQAIVTANNDWNVTDGLATIIKNILEEGGVQFPESNRDLSRDPLENRWIGKYGTYGTNDFLAEGNITTNAVASGSYLVEQPIATEKLFVNNNLGQTILYNNTINSITISGSAKIEVQSNLCNLTTGEDNAIPSYVTLKYENSSIKMSVNTRSRIEIYTVNGNYSIDDGSVVIETTSADLVFLKPQIIVNGIIAFSQISLPSDSAAWTYNVQLVGNLDFRIGYSDGNYMFIDNFDGEYNRIVQNDAIIDVIPWKDVLLSLPNILLIIGIIFLGTLTFRKSKTHDIPHKRID